MNATSYELRTLRGTPVFSFDVLGRALEERKKHEQRVGTPLRIVECVRLERDITDEVVK